MVQVVFEGLLNQTLTHTGGKAASISAASASQLRYLVLRNLASLLAGEDASAPRALSLYAQALMLDEGDSVVWNHMGTLVSLLLLAQDSADLTIYCALRALLCMTAFTINVPTQLPAYQFVYAGNCGWGLS